MPLADQFWGDRYGQLRHPFGHSWSIAAPIAKVQTQMAPA
jgi:PhnB protein